MKHKKKIKHPLKKLMRGNILIVLLFVVVAFGVLLTSGAMVNKSAVDKTEQFGEEEVSPESGKQNLQLKTLKFKPKPTPKTDSCNHDMSKPIDDLDTCECTAWVVKCEGGKCVDVDLDKSGMPGTKDSICQLFDQSSWCQAFSGGKDGWYCIGKPVIYLYPEKETYVNVSVKTEGKVVVSDPQIENYGDRLRNATASQGWKNVLAYPNGTLFYQGKQYRELFYESETKEVKRPERGLVMEKSKLRTSLLSFIAQLGLTREDEQMEFLDWWIPRLERINSEKLFVSILEKDEKERLDKVFISPKPDTFIEFIAYFAPLSENEMVEPLVLPPTPERKGFTAIEWGGVIGR